MMDVLVENTGNLLILLNKDNKKSFDEMFNFVYDFF